MKRRVKEGAAHRGTHKEDISPKTLARKRRGAEFQELLLPEGLEPGVLKVSGNGWDRARRALPSSWQEGKQTTQGHLAYKQ